MRQLKGYTVADVETTITNSFKRVADPFNELNWTVYVGHRSSGEKDVTKDRYETKQQSMGWLGRLLEDKWPMILVGFNLKFDILQGIAQDPWSYAVYKKWIVAGGQLWDCQLAEYLLEGMLPEAQMLSLDEVAPKYGGKLKEGGDVMKEMWKAGICTTEISPDIVYPYLDGDITNTEAVLLGQMKRARDCGQTKSILLNMGAQVYIIEAEKNGIHADLALGLKLAAELEVEIAGLKAEMQQYVPADLPPELVWSWTSRTKLSALIFGGKVKYQKKVHQQDDMGNLLYAQKSLPGYVLQDGSVTLQPPLPEGEGSMGQPNIMAYVVIGSGKQAGSYKTKQVKVDDLDKPKTKLTDFWYTFPGYTQPEKKWEGKTAGVYSTAEDIITELGVRDIPFLKAMARHAKAVKDLGTYFITDDPKAAGGKKGMLTLVRANGIIHHQINQTSTVTGRFSASNPNTQNLPRAGEGKSVIKTVLTSRYDGGYIIQSDFSSLEIYIQAILTGDKNLIADLKLKLDMHCKRVASQFGIEYAEAVRLCKTEEIEEWVEKRSKAKGFSFQRAFGAGAVAIAAATGLSVDAVNTLIAAEQLLYPDIEPHYARLTAQIEKAKRNVRKVIPHPDFPSRMVELRTGYHRTPDNKLYAWIEQPAPKYVVQRGGGWTSFSPPEIKNYEVQGGGAEWAKAAMWIAVKEYYRRDNWGGQAALIGQVHDACYADAAKEVHAEAAAVLHCAMELASPFMEAYFGWPQPVYVPSDTTIGANWAGHDKVVDFDKYTGPIGAEMHKLYIDTIKKAA
jgi:hypothetical protein